MLSLIKLLKEQRIYFNTVMLRIMIQTLFTDMK